jgi:hypothetical protein
MVFWDTDTIPMKDRGTLSSLETLIEVYMRSNEPQRLRDKHSRGIKILDAEYKQVSLNDVHQGMWEPPCRGTAST